MAQKFKGNVNVEGNLNLPNSTANRVPVIDGSNNVSSSSVTSTELGHLSGVTSSIQTQLGNKIDSSEKGANNGVATLDGGGKVPVTQLPNSIMQYVGVYNATTNTPALADGAGNADSDIGNVYRVSVAGTQDFGSGNITFAVGDYVILNESKIWEKSDTTDSVVSVNSQTGIVVLDTDDISEGTNQYFTDERAQDAVGNALLDTASIDFTYNDAGNQISADVLPAGVNHNALQNYVANEHTDHSSVSIQTQANSGLSGGGDITATRSLVVDITGTTAETVADNADEILIYDVSATARRKMTRSNFLTGIALSSSGDISESSFSGANNQASPANVTGLAFSNSVVRSFTALVSIAVDATSDLFESYTLNGINIGGSFSMEQSSVGDNSLVTFSITSGGQVQYTSGSYAGFSSLTIKFRAITTSV